MSLIERRVIPGTALAAYGHGDWNDSLQPADPRLREHMCSAWTVTLHYQTLTTLAAALRDDWTRYGRRTFRELGDSSSADFQRLLLVDGVLAGYAVFEERRSYPLPAASERYQHRHPLQRAGNDPRDTRGHAVTGSRSAQHLRIIDEHLSGPDGVRLFDRPMAYHGGTQRLFQRAETATFFGREIGLMYMHAHLRYAQALAHVGEAERFFKALCQANPIAIRSIVEHGDPATVQLLLLQLRCGLRRSLSGHCRIPAHRRRVRSRSMAAGACTRAARVSRSG